MPEELVNVGNTYFMIFVMQGLNEVITCKQLQTTVQVEMLATSISERRGKPHSRNFKILKRKPGPLRAL